MSSLKSQRAQILVTRRVEQVEGEPLMLKAHHRRGDRDAALALDRHPVRAHPRRSPRALTSPASWIAPPNSSNFSVSVVLPASGCEMIANVRRRKISSLRLLINPFQLFRGAASSGERTPRAYTNGGYDDTRPHCQRLPLRTRVTSCFACFIRSRSGVAASLQSEPSARSWAPICAEVPCDYGNRMVDQRSAGTDRCPR